MEGEEGPTPAKRFPPLFSAVFPRYTTRRNEGISDAAALFPPPRKQERKI